MGIGSVCPRWLARAALAVAALKIAAGLVAFLLGQLVFGLDLTSFRIPPVVYAADLLVWGSAALLLMAGGHADIRARTLGALFLVSGSAFADRLLVGINSTLPPALAPAAGVWAHVHPLAFVPMFVWIFASKFPVAVAFGSRARIAKAGISVSVVASTTLFAANIAAPLVLPKSNDWIVTAVLEPATLTTVVILELGALAFIIWQTPFAAIKDKRRVRIFVAGLAAGSAPVLLENLFVAVVPAFRRWVENPTRHRLVDLVLHFFILSIPVTTAYSVLVDRVLDVRLVIRRAVQYALARSTLFALFTVPVVISLVYVYMYRRLTISELVGARPLVVIALLGLALIVFRIRPLALESLDRRFFREQYDSHQILIQLVDKSRRATDLTGLIGLLIEEIDRALHLDGVTVLVTDAGTGTLWSPLIPVGPLALSSPLVTLVGGDAAPLDVDLESKSSPLRRLPEQERQWLADTGCRLIVPLIGSSSSLVGLLALGEKKSELRFSSEDRMFLSSIAASAALTLENQLLRSTPSSGIKPEPRHRVDLFDHARAEEDKPASECERCFALYPENTTTCPDCGTTLVMAAVPLHLSAKFRLERRIGAGGMGVVYRATDLILHRSVAIKTLPRMSPERGVRLRREARAMAAITHPNLALIFGAESWRGTPMLVFELLDGGTLADRLNTSRLPPIEVLALGISMAGVLEKSHAVGILHRDIKPSNIGFTADGVPKLLDFGLARLLHQPVGSSLDLTELTTTAEPVIAAERLIRSGRLVGTIPYLSPEAARSRPPDPSVDLWSLTVVLFEALTGKNPFAGKSIFETIAAIDAARVPSLGDVLPGSPPALVSFFRDALSADLGTRPSTARELRQQLETLHEMLAGGNEKLASRLTGTEEAGYIASQNGYSVKAKENP